MKEWPDDETSTVSYEELISPIKKLLLEGYRMERYQNKQFVYSGYNIGKSERLTSPTPDERFSSRWLENEEKFKRTLLDNVFATVFQLGIEQGRRFDKINRYNNSLLRDIVDARTRTITKLRAELGKYDPSYAVSNDIPAEKDDDSLLIDNMELEELGSVDVQDAKEVIT